MLDAKTISLMGSTWDSALHKNNKLAHDKHSSLFITVSDEENEFNKIEFSTIKHFTAVIISYCNKLGRLSIQS